MAKYCKKCGYHIVKSYDSFGGYVHQPPGAAFMDQSSRYCQTSVAEDGIEYDGMFPPDKINLNDYKEND